MFLIMENEFIPLKEELTSQQQNLEISENGSADEKSRPETKKEKQTIRVRSISECVETGKKLPKLIKLFGQFLHRGEITILCGDTGVGKSILAVQMAKAISEGNVSNKLIGCEGEGEIVCYFDFELGDRQFSLRYPETEFSDNLKRADLDPDCDSCSFTIQEIKKAVKHWNASVIIIDNVTAVSLRNTADPEQALKLM